MEATGSDGVEGVLDETIATIIAARPPNPTISHRPTRFRFFFFFLAMGDLGSTGLPHLEQKLSPSAISIPHLGQNMIGTSAPSCDNPNRLRSVTSRLVPIWEPLCGRGRIRRAEGKWSLATD